MVKKLFVIFIDFGKQMSRKNIGAFASSTAFFLFLSLIPIIMLMCSFLPYTMLTEQDMLTAIMKVVPEFIEPLLITIISDVYEQSAGIISIAILVTMWSAGKGMLALIRGLNAINEVDENRNYFMLRAVSSVYTVFILIAMLVSLAIMVFGNTFVDTVIISFPQAARVMNFLRHFRFLFSWCVLTIVFTVIYTYVPSENLKFKKQIPGAIFSAIIWNFFSFVFSIYIKYFNGFSTYGSLTTIIIIMLWLYFCIYIVMIGAYLNKYFGPVYKFFFPKIY